MDELYDLKADPGEMKNLIADPGAQSALKEMKQELQLLQAPHGRAELLDDCSVVMLIARLILLPYNQTSAKLSEWHITI